MKKGCVDSLLILCKVEKHKVSNSDCAGNWLGPFDDLVL